MYRLKQEVAVSDSGFLLNPSTGESFSLNPMGVTVVDMLRQGKAYEEIEAYVLEHYDTQATTVDKDFQDFIGMLKQYDLIAEEGEEQ